MVIIRKYRSETELVERVNAQDGPFDDKNYVSMQDDNDVNNSTQFTGNTKAMEIQNYTYVVPIDNTNLNQETPRTSVSR